jgi:hypothetical protein
VCHTTSSLTRHQLFTTVPPSLRKTHSSGPQCIQLLLRFSSSFFIDDSSIFSPTSMSTPLSIKTSHLFPYLITKQTPSHLFPSLLIKQTTSPFLLSHLYINKHKPHHRLCSHIQQSYPYKATFSTSQSGSRFSNELQSHAFPVPDDSTPTPETAVMLVRHCCHVGQTLLSCW